MEGLDKADWIHDRMNYLDELYERMLDEEYQRLDYELQKVLDELEATDEIKPII